LSLNLGHFVPFSDRDSTTVLWNRKTRLKLRGYLHLIETFKLLNSFIVKISTIKITDQLLKFVITLVTFI